MKERESERTRERARAHQRGISVKRDEGTEKSGKVQLDGARRDTWTFGMVKVYISYTWDQIFCGIYVTVLFDNCGCVCVCVLVSTLKNKNI